MRQELVEALWTELARRGFRDGVAANDTMGFSRAYLMLVDSTELLAAMSARREKVWNSVATVGQKAAREAVEDVDLALSAIRFVIEDFLSRS